MSSSVRYARSASAETSPVGDRVVLYDNRTHKAVVLNPTGAQLWQALSTPRSAAELSQQLQARYPSADATQIAHDVEACLHELVKQEVLREEA